MSFLSVCSDLRPLIKLVKTLLSLIQIGIPIILIVLATFDLGKAVVASKEDEIKAAQKILVKRFIYAIAIFFVFFVVKLVFNTISQNTEDTTEAADWVRCWDCDKVLKVFGNTDEKVCSSECKYINGDVCMQLK